ncbi:MAG TPA: hypothetical protein VMY79_00955 [Dehalococcoidia bacterium]|nr:hypothetical protein [Dehalococcoidia bacterium]
MAKKVIQVPIGEGLLKDLDNLSKKQRRARAEVIRHACLGYLRQVECEEMDRLYQQGYEKIPEEPEIGEVQLALAGQVIPRELW